MNDDEKAWRQAWESDRNLRAEFRDDSSAYLAFNRAKAKGLVRVCRGGQVVET